MTVIALSATRSVVAPAASSRIVHCPSPRLAALTAIKVADTLTALGDLAHYRRQQFAPKVLAITGSNGKNYD
mgnify:CR=1 FL=1